MEIKSSPAPARVAVAVAGSSVVHAGRVVGKYAESGNPKYGKLCTSAGRDNHYPYAVPGAEITCKRCLAKIAATTPVKAPADAPYTDAELEAAARVYSHIQDFTENNWPKYAEQAGWILAAAAAAR